MSKPVISNTFSLTAIKQGDDGTPGGNTATLFLFKRSATPITAIDWNYALTYNFASQSLSSTPSGWTLNKVPAGTDPVYVTAATAYSTETSDTIAASEWSTPVLYTENTNAATIFLFKRSATAITVHGITSDNVYYKFADGKLYNGTGSSASVISDLNGWTRNIPTDDGKPCYVIQATAVGTGTHDQILHTEWSDVVKFVEDGIILHLDNQHEDFLYDDAGNNKSGSVTSQATLLNGGVNIAASDVNWSIDSSKSSGVLLDTSSSDFSTKGTSINSSGLLTVKGLTAATAKVTVKAEYPKSSGKYYYAAFTANKTSQDKYDLVIKPNSIAYNPASYSTQTINISAKRTDMQGNQTSADISTTSGSGQLRLFRSYVNRSDGSMTTASQLTTLSPTVDGSTANSYSGVYFELRKYANASGGNTSSYAIVDYQTVPITKAQNGNNAVTMSLDNQHEDFLYDDAGNNKSGSATSQATVNDGGTDVAASDVNWSIDSSKSSGVLLDTSSSDFSTKGTSINSSGLLTVKGLTAATAKVTVKAEYPKSSGKYYYAAFTANKTSQDKYDLVIKPNSIAYNPASYSTQTINISAKRTDMQGNQTSADISTTSGSGQLRLFRSYVNRSDGSMTTASQLATLAPTVDGDTANAYSGVYFELRKYANASGGNTSSYAVVDYQTVSITKASDGGTGNGINNVTLYRMFTQGFEEPLANDSGWKAPSDSNYPTETGLSKENRYLWQKKVTTYTKTSETTTEISLLAQFDSGLCENLLEDTAFLSEGQMEAWDAKNGSIGINTNGEHNSFGGDPVWADRYTELLQQRVYRSGVIQKLKSNTWYTLSFVAAQANYGTLFSGTTWNGDGDTNYGYVNKVNKQFFIEKNNTVKLQFTGYNASSNVRMTCYLFCRRASSSDREISTSQQITGTGTKTVTLTLQNTTGRDTVFECEVVVYDTSTGNVNTNSGSNYRGYIQALTIDRGARMATYLYRSDDGQAVIHSASAPWYVDGKKITAATTLDDGESGNPLRKGTYADFDNDGGVYWQLSPGHVRHTVTFKTPTLASDVDYHVLFRMTSESNYGWVSVPKLEENTMATDWIEHSNDRMADDIQHVYVGEWKASTSDPSTNYFYGGGTGVRHVVRAKESVSGAKTYFRMKKRTTSAGYKSTIEPYNDTEHWEKAAYLKFVAADLLLAEEVIVENLITTQIKSKNNTFVVDADGNITAKKGTFENAIITGKVTGSLRNPFTYWNDPDATYNKDNLVAYTTASGWHDDATEFTIPWDVNQSGRVIHIADYKWDGGDSPSSGWGYITAPSGKYFYENGRAFSRIFFSRSFIELTGYGSPTNFWGWIVTKRQNLMTNGGYGVEQRVVMMGRINGRTTSDGTKVSGVGYKFDGTLTSLSLTREDEGIYKLTIPSTWNIQPDGIQVQVTPIGFIKDGTNMILNGSVRGFETSNGNISAVIFQLSDDQTTNDGDLFFSIYNMKDLLVYHAKI